MQLAPDGRPGPVGKGEAIALAGILSVPFPLGVIEREAPATAAAAGFPDILVNLALESAPRATSALFGAAVEVGHCLYRPW